VLHSSLPLKPVFLFLYRAVTVLNGDFAEDPTSNGVVDWLSNDKIDLFYSEGILYPRKDSVTSSSSGGLVYQVRKRLQGLPFLLIADHLLFDEQDLTAAQATYTLSVKLHNFDTEDTYGEVRLQLRDNDDTVLAQGTDIVISETRQDIAELQFGVLDLTYQIPASSDAVGKSIRVAIEYDFRATFGLSLDQVELEEAISIPATTSSTTSRSSPSSTNSTSNSSSTPCKPGTCRAATSCARLEGGPP